MTITQNWTKPIPIEPGKDIIIKFSEDYFFVSIQITGKEETGLRKAFFGANGIIIYAYEIGHIPDAEISFRAEQDGTIEVELKQEEANSR